MMRHIFDDAGFHQIFFFRLRIQLENTLEIWVVLNLLMDELSLGKKNRLSSFPDQKIETY